MRVQLRAAQRLGERRHQQVRQYEAVHHRQVGQLARRHLLLPLLLLLLLVVVVVRVVRRPAAAVLPLQLLLIARGQLGPVGAAVSLRPS